MKKLIIAFLLAMVCILTLAGCNNRNLNYIIANEPSITGIVKDTNDHFILIENENGKYWVSRKVENSDGIYSPITIGDEVMVYYDGNIKEIILSSSIESRHQISTVYAILLIVPADRTINETS